MCICEGWSAPLFSRYIDRISIDQVCNGVGLSISRFLQVRTDEQADGKTQTQTVKQVDRNLPCFSISIHSSFKNILSTNEWMLVY